MREHFNVCNVIALVEKYSLKEILFDSKWDTNRKQFRLSVCLSDGSQSEIDGPIEIKIQFTPNQNKMEEKWRTSQYEIINWCFLSDRCEWLKHYQNLYTGISQCSSASARIFVSVFTVCVCVYRNKIVTQIHWPVFSKVQIIFRVPKSKKQKTNIRPTMETHNA